MGKKKKNQFGPAVKEMLRQFEAATSDEDKRDIASILAPLKNLDIDRGMLKVDSY